MNTLESARQAWVACATMRATRRRLKNFTYGRQWDDITVTSQGERVSEGEYAARTGRRPLTNNLLRSLVKCVVGRFRQDVATRRSADAAEGTEMSPRLARIYSTNRLDELDARAMEEFLISGCAIQKVSYERRFEGEQVWIDNVCPDRFFCNRYLDPRGHDIRLVGMLHEMSLAEMRMRFAHNNRRRQREMAQMFSRAVRMSGATGVLADVLGSDGADVMFGSSSDPQRCRVIEVWTFDDEGRSAGTWHGRFYTPDGTLLDETVSPYAHGSHPFVVTLYPLTDGEVHPFIEDVIDQQRHINQIISLIDQILAHSAKGTLLYPTDAMVDGVPMDEVLRLWSRPGAVIPVNQHATKMPFEIISPGRSEGASVLLDLEMKMMQQISGVSNALQGQNIGGNTSASLYQTQVQNSAIALLDIFETFNSFRSARDAKALAILSR
ncbi:MAG: hypothetical protein K2K77_08120 [Duncaniella sp.]|nr:hypothetical protein [Duncaniella sp.]